MFVPAAPKVTAGKETTVQSSTLLAKLRRKSSKTPWFVKMLSGTMATR